METYTCSCCGKELNDWPALTYKTPFFYSCLTEEEKQHYGKLTSDFCTVEMDGETHRFIRVVMFQKTSDSCQVLDYGLWVSLSEASYNDYYEHYEDENYKEVYFGWLNSSLSGYPDTTAIPCNVCPQKNNQRPFIEPHQSFDHPLVADFYNGISKEEAEARIKRMMGE